MGDAAQTERSNYHLTLGDLIDTLEAADNDLPVVFTDGTSPGTPKSYRGYYSDLAFSDSDETVTVAELLARARKANGKTYTGYKGGDFTMGDTTPLWRAEWGDIGIAIMGIALKADEVLLVQKEE